MLVKRKCRTVCNGKYPSVETALKYWGRCGYKAEKYWKERLEKYGFDPRGVGNKSISSEKNEEVYEKAGKRFIGVCNINLPAPFSRVKLLDIGCGNGFYANILRNCGVKNYTGIDVTDILFKDLRRMYPEYRFKKLDVTKHKIQEKYDVIIMIDVTQHITANRKFSFAMQNIKRSLKEGGVFIVTSWLTKGLRNSYYEISRRLEDYEREFKGFHVSNSIPFRDKHIFAIKRENTFNES